MLVVIVVGGGDEYASLVTGSGSGDGFYLILSFL